MFSTGVIGRLCRFFFFFQAEDGIRDLVRSRGLGDVYKRQVAGWPCNLVFNFRKLANSLMSK